MSYLQVFINAIVVALMAMYVYENERKMEKMSTKHDQTEKELHVLKIVAKSKEDQIKEDQIKELKQLLSTKAGTEKLTEIENQQIAGTRKLTDVENQLNAETRNQAKLENQQNTATRKLAEVENQVLMSNEKVLALEKKLVDEIKDMKQLLSTKAEKKEFKQIFVACNGNKQSILDTWKKPTMGGDISNIKDSCTNRHLRSPMIDNWNGSLIDQVKVELFKNGKLTVEIYFDGRGSTNGNWFTKERLHSNSFNDLTQMSTFKFFAIDGDKSCDRHFFIHQIYGGCPGDKGWMIIVDTADTGYRPCMFDKLPGMNYPYILYGPGRQMAHYDAGLYAVADMMVISISTRD